MAATFRHPDDPGNRLRRAELLAWFEVQRAYDRLCDLPVAGKVGRRRYLLKRSIRRRVAAWWRALCALHPHPVASPSQHVGCDYRMVGASHHPRRPSTMMPEARAA